MPPKKQPFTTEQEYLLIHAVKNRPELWDVSHPMYRRNDIKETLWQEVADLIDSHITAEIVRERFINMRTTFMNNEKRIRESKQKCSGKGADEIYKPKWSLYTSLLFLKKACVQTESSSNLDVLGDDESQVSITTDINNEINNNLLAVQNNIRFDSNVQKWVLLSSDTEDSSHTSFQETSTKVLNPSLLDHVYCPDSSEQASTKNLLSANVPASNYKSHTLNTSSKRTAFSCPSSSSESTSSTDVINLESPAFEDETVRLTSASLSLPPNSTSVIQNKKQCNEDPVYVKRGTMKRKVNVMEEAVEALKKISNEKMPQIPQSQSSHTADACEYLGLFIAARLREMDPDIRLRCEVQIMKILSTVATIET